MSSIPISSGMSHKKLFTTSNVIASLVLLSLFVGLALPMLTIGDFSFSNKEGAFIGLDNFAEYFSSQSPLYSIGNTFKIGLITTCLVISLAFIYAYALNRSQIPGKKIFKTIAFLPILAPSLMPAISLVYLFGNQGLIKEALMGESIYGPIGIAMGLGFWCFPHALIIINTALSIADQRLYESCKALGASKLETFFTVTLPSAKYGLISAVLVTFTLTITDFGVPKVIGGQFNVLATDIYKQVVGQQNFQMGAVVSMLLLLPALLTFAIDRYLRSKQKDMVDHRATPYQPEKNRLRDTLLFIYCLVITGIILAFIGTAIYASFISFWPYNMELTLSNYQFEFMDGGGWSAYFNSLEMAAWTALFGTCFVVLSVYMTEKVKVAGWLRQGIQGLALMPMAIPGMVLGLAYIFFFNHPDNPLNFLYGSMAILVISTIVHYYTVSHMTATTSLKQIDSAIESVSASLKVPQWVTFFKVTVAMSLPAILDIGFYYFVNAMTTVSAVVFLYSSDTMLASVAVLNMDDAGDIAPAAAMASMIFVTSAMAKVLYSVLSHGVLKHTQGWQR